MGEAINFWNIALSSALPNFRKIRATEKDTAMGIETIQVFPSDVRYGSLEAIWLLVRLVFHPYFFYQSTVFFSYDKSANSIFRCIATMHSTAKTSKPNGSAILDLPIWYLLKFLKLKDQTKNCFSLTLQTLNAINSGTNTNWDLSRWQVARRTSRAPGHQSSVVSAVSLSTSGSFQLISCCRHNTHNVAVRQARISVLMKIGRNVQTVLMQVELLCRCCIFSLKKDKTTIPTANWTPLPLTTIWTSLNCKQCILQQMKQPQES